MPAPFKARAQARCPPRPPLARVVEQKRARRRRRRLLLDATRCAEAPALLALDAAACAPRHPPARYERRPTARASRSARSSASSFLSSASACCRSTAALASAEVSGNLSPAAAAGLVAAAAGGGEGGFCRCAGVLSPAFGPAPLRGGDPRRPRLLSAEPGYRTIRLLDRETLLARQFGGGRGRPGVPGHESPRPSARSPSRRRARGYIRERASAAHLEVCTSEVGTTNAQLCASSEILSVTIASLRFGFEARIAQRKSV